MILRKMMVDGQEIHVAISTEEAKTRYLNQETLVFTDETEKAQFLHSLENKSEERPKSKPKMHRLVQMLPFMDEDTIHDLVEKLLQEDGLEGIDVGVVLPFLDEKDATALFKKALKGDNPRLNPMMIAPFVDADALSYVVDEYIAGHIPEHQLDALYPFMNESDLKRLFKHIVEKE